MRNPTEFQELQKNWFSENDKALADAISAVSRRKAFAPQRVSSTATGLLSYRTSEVTIDTSGGVIALTLPQANSLGDDRAVVITMTHVAGAAPAGIVTLAGDTITHTGGTNTIGVYPGEVVQFRSDGISAWTWSVITPALQAYTPRLDGFTTQGVGTYTTQAGKWSRNGKMIWFEATVSWTAHTGTGLSLVTIPFPPGAVSSPIGILTTGFAVAADTWLQCTIQAATGACGIFTNTLGTLANLAVPAAGVIVLSGTYPAAL